MSIIGKLTFVFAMSFGIFAWTAGCTGQEGVQRNDGLKLEGGNIAIGCKYEMIPAPNYGRCKDKDDAIQLTNGVKCQGPSQLWVQKEAIGWKDTLCPTITVDLGKVMPISGVSLHTAFDGPMNVLWPLGIPVFVSEDGREFHYVCDLVDPKWPDSPFPPDVPAIKGQRLAFYEYGRKDLETKGRFVKFAMRVERYAFCDEIEVYKGSDAFLSKPLPGKPIEDVTWYLAGDTVNGALTNELKAIAGNATTLKVKDGLAGKFDELGARIAGSQWLKAPPADFRTTVPMNELHRDVLKLNAEAMRKGGLKPLTVWNSSCWASLKSTKLPEAGQETQALPFELMRGECRAKALNLTNADTDDLKADVVISGFPAGIDIKLHQVEFTGTKAGGGQFVADALPEAKKDGGAFKIDVPSGMTRQLWLNCFSKNTAPGTYKGALEIVQGGRSLAKVPVSVKVHPLDFPAKPSLSLFCFDYTDKPYGFKGMTDRNVAMAIEDMRAHYVDTAWGHRVAACWPKEGDFDKAGNLVKPLRTAAFDDWTARNEGCANFFLYVGDGLETFAGEPIGTPRFEWMLSQWITKFAEHAKSKGIEAKRLGVHFIDEPLKGGVKDFETNVVYMRIVKRAVPEIRIFTDASGYEKGYKQLVDMLAPCDIVCPHVPTYFNKMGSVRNAIERAKGEKTLFFYSCVGFRNMDPYFYYRVSAWQSFKNNAEGMGFWVYWNEYGDNAATDWNELFLRPAFGLVYKTDDSIVSSKRWEAVREGVEDYEYLAMLRSRIGQLKAKKVDNDLMKEAELLCVSLPEEVVEGYERVQGNSFMEEGRGSRDAADIARVKILNMLCKLKALDKQ